LFPDSQNGYCSWTITKHGEACRLAPWDLIPHGQGMKWPHLENSTRAYAIPLDNSLRFTWTFFSFAGQFRGIRITHSCRPFPEHLIIHELEGQRWTVNLLDSRWRCRQAEKKRIKRTCPTFDLT
jgi:hypothetical protein